MKTIPFTVSSKRIKYSESNLKKKEVYIQNRHIMEYWRAFKNKEIKLFATRMNLENIMLSEIRQTQNREYTHLSYLK